MSFEWTTVDERVARLLSRFGAAACGAELVCDAELCGHITAAARIWNRDHTRLVRVWSAKNSRWQLPGAHGDGDLDLEKVARREAARALGLPAETDLDCDGVVGVNAEEVDEYWNTPAHFHLEIVFEFQTEEWTNLPPGAQWFEMDTASENH